PPCRHARNRPEGWRGGTAHAKPLRPGANPRPVHRPVQEDCMRTLLLLLLFPLLANAQYDGPGVEVCRLFAQRQLVRDANTARTVVIERDNSLTIERYT